MPTNRCSIIVRDPETKRFRKCKKNKNHFSCICSNHCYKYIVLIQSVWRSYYIRKKVQLFSKLPIELWNIIVSFHKIELMQFKRNFNNIHLNYINIYEKKKLNVRGYEYQNLMIDNKIKEIRDKFLYKLCV